MPVILNLIKESLKPVTGEAQPGRGISAALVFFPALYILRVFLEKLPTSLNQNQIKQGLKGFRCIQAMYHFILYKLIWDKTKYGISIKVSCHYQPIGHLLSL